MPTGSLTSKSMKNNIGSAPCGQKAFGHQTFDQYSIISSSPSSQVLTKLKRPFVVQMFFGQMSAGQMSFGQMSVGKISVSQMSVHQIFAFQMSVGQMLT